MREDSQRTLPNYGRIVAQPDFETCAGLNEWGRNARGLFNATSTEHYGPAFVFTDVAEKGCAGANATVMGCDVYEYSLVGIELSQRHLNFLGSHNAGFQHRLSGGLIGHTDPRKVGGHAVVRTMHLDAELIGRIQYQDIAAKMADVCPCFTIEIDRDEE